MKSIGAINAAALILLFGIATPAVARQEKQEESAKPPKQEEKDKPVKQEEARPPKQEEKAKPEKQPEEKGKTAKQEQPAKPEKQEQAKGRQESGSSHAPQRTQEAQARQHSQPALRLSVRGSGRIPDERFHASFGHEHVFSIGTPVLVGGYSRFQYGGFWFGFVQPWPDGWYYTDDVYIDYVDGGYYMYNPYYPGARFSISVVI